MGSDTDQERLRRLGDRIARMKGVVDPPRNVHADAHTQGQMAWRMVTELVAGLVVGFGIGYGLDALLGSGPWLMLIFTGLGFVAGVRGLMRTAHAMQRTLEAEAAQRSGTTQAPQRGTGTAGPGPATGQREDTTSG